MWQLLLAALQLPAPQPATPPTDLSYVLVGTGDAEAREILEGLVAGEPGVRRAATDPALFAGCAMRSLPDRVGRCVRALLPDRVEAPPVVAVALEDASVSNVTGSVVHKRHNIRCIGRRSVARVELGSRLSASSADKAKPLLHACLAEVLAAEAERGGGEGPDGARLWRIPVRPERLAGDAPLAKGASRERAIVEILDAITPHRVTGRCSVRARIIHVEGGEQLRAGDEVEFAAPCRYDAPDPVSRMMQQNSVFTGQTARIYIDYDDGALRFFEAL